MPDMQSTPVRVDRDTFPGVALAACPADAAQISHILAKIKAGDDFPAASLNNGKIIAMQRQDWQTLYTAWHRVTAFDKMLDDANKAMQDMTKEMML